VLATDLVRREHEVVETESPGIERTTDFAHHPVRPFRLELPDVHELVAAH